MAEFEITAPDGRKVTVSGDSAPTEADAARIFAVIGQQKPSLFQRAKAAINPPREGFREYVGGGSPESVLASEIQLGDKNAYLSADEYGNPTIVTERGTFYPNRPGISVADVTGFLSGVERTAQDVAPYLAGGVATAPLRAATQTLAQGGIGLAQEAIKQTGNAIEGKQVDWSRLATTPLFAMAGDAAGRLAYRVAAPAIARIIGSQPAIRVVNSDGTLSDDAVRMLRAAGSTPDDFAKAAASEADSLKRTGVLTQEQAERFNFFKEMGLEPTTAQVTRSADDFRVQQDLAARSSGVRSALENQEAQLTQAFDTRIMGTGGATTGSPISDAVIGKATALDAEISSLYNEARQAAPGAKNVRLESMVETLRRRAPDNEFTGGLIRSIRGDLVERGVMNNRFQVTGKIDVDTAETIRQVLNSNFNSTNAKGRMIIRELKERLDDDVLAIAGQDVFDQARRARADFSAQLRPDKVSKFDINERSLVEDIMDNTIKADDVFDKTVLSNNAKPSDLVQLKRYLTAGSEEQAASGLRAWSSLRAQTLDWVKQNAFNGPVDAAGNQAMSRAGLERALSRIGDDKIKVIFSAEEAKFLDDMLKLAKLREPVRRTALGGGPSAQAIEKLERSIMARLPVVGPFYDFFKAAGMIRADQAATQQILNPASGTVQALTRAAMTPANAPQAQGAARGISAYFGTGPQMEQR